MSFLASARRVVRAPADACFARLVDFSSWKDWMPPSFRPMRGPSGRPLQPGDVAWVRITGAPFPVRLVVVRADARVRAVAWRGGAPGLLAAEHAFYFDDDAGGGTLARSEETWWGAASYLGPLARTVKSQAERVGEDQLAALARAVE